MLSFQQEVPTNTSSIGIPRRIGGGSFVLPVHVLILC